MLKKTITYTDYNGNERTEDCYFNLSPMEVAELGLTSDSEELDNMKELISKQETINSNDTYKILDLYNKIILKAYGKKSDDGREFIKSKELSEQFSRTEIYNILFMEICTDEKSASEFFNSILPAGMKASMQKG